MTTEKLAIINSIMGMIDKLSTPALESLLSKIHQERLQAAPQQNAGTKITKLAKAA